MNQIEKSPEENGDETPTDKVFEIVETLKFQVADKINEIYEELKRLRSTSR